MRTTRPTTPRDLIMAGIGFLLLCIVLGIVTAAAQGRADVPACTDRPGNLWNECASLDPSQVQDRRTVAPTVTVTAPTTVVVTDARITVTVAPDGPSGLDTVPCQHEDGSGAGQEFPCYWDGGPNGQGDTYVLDRPM